MPESSYKLTSVTRYGNHAGIRMVAIGFLIVTFVGLDFLELGTQLTNNDNNLSRTVELRPAGSGPGAIENQRDFRSKADLSFQGLREAVAQPSIVELAAVSSEAYTWRAAPWKKHVGEWLDKCGGTSEPLPIDEVVSGQVCPGDCNGRGVCNHELGKCRCQLGYQGPGCTLPDEYPCNWNATAVDPFGRPGSSICGARCDTSTARCFCAANSSFPERPAVEHCAFVKDKAGVPQWRQLDLEALYSKDEARPGWCEADPAKLREGGATPRQLCYCNYDGRGGELCEIPYRAYCLGGCNGHGDCHMGYCQCENGWYGIDCSIPSEKTNVDDPPPPWLLGEGGIQGRRFLGRSRSVIRRRPHIYIYDLPPQYNIHHLQGRKWKFNCVAWQYSEANTTEFMGGFLYGMEVAVYEALLASPHRTTNGEEADYFYVPVLTGCINARGDDSPRLDSEHLFGFNRPYLAMVAAKEAYEHILAEYPFWNRSQGQDHIWMYPWDEGACYAPQVIWNSIMLTPWGNTMTKHKTSTTAYPDDNWDIIPKEIRGDHPCFDPVKDIVMPNWKAPDVSHMKERPWERPLEERPTFFYFAGNLGAAFGGRPEANYSMGIRQKVGKVFASVTDKEGSLGNRTEENVVVSTHTGAYTTELATSRFCGVFPGDGFSARMEDSVLHGCIPVIVQDGIQLSFENMLDYSTFAVRIAEEDIPNMVTILKDISADRVRAMQASVGASWQRWSYLSVTRGEGARQRAWHGDLPEWAREAEQLKDDDAIATLMQILHYKMYNDPWRKGQLGKELRQKKRLGVDPKCTHQQSSANTKLG